jgi:hypothetical protein
MNYSDQHSLPKYPIVMAQQRQIQFAGLCGSSARRSNELMTAHCDGCMGSERS